MINLNCFIPYNKLYHLLDENFSLFVGSTFFRTSDGNHICNIQQDKDKIPEIRELIRKSKWL